MPASVVITGIGMVTPLGQEPAEVLRRIQEGQSAAAAPAGFDASPFACPVCAQVRDFQPQRYVEEVKMVRLMNRDAQLAVAAARLALRDAGLQVGTHYAPQEIALYGATGLAGLPFGEVAALIKNSTGPNGQVDPARFGQQGLKSISPLLSFKVLGNMPVCFVSICENIQGPNSIYTPWEGQGAQAIEAGVRTVQSGQARCALVGGCDVKTHEVAFIILQQLGLFQAWKEAKTGMVPGEGAVFLVVENQEQALARGARAYARLAGFGMATDQDEARRTETWCEVLRQLPERATNRPLGAIVAASDTADKVDQDEAAALSALTRISHHGARTLLSASLPSDALAADKSVRAPHTAFDTQPWGEKWGQNLAADTTLFPKRHAGNLFAAAAALQVGLGALLAQRLGRRVLANCFGYGSEQAAFLLEAP
jgi:hypothetical protein